MKPKAKTLIERMGFKDEDLTDKKHDKIMLWLLDKKNVLKMIKDLFKPTGGWLWRACKFADRINYNWNICNFDWDNINCSLKCELSDDEKQAIIDEYKKAREVYKREQHILDLIDIKLEVPICRKGRDVKLLKNPVPEGSQYIIGFIDVVISITEKQTIFKGKYFELGLTPPKGVPREIYVEVKSNIKSIGELIRQINYYRSYCPGIWVVVSPHDSLDEVLKSQGIYHYRVPLEEV